MNSTATPPTAAPHSGRPTESVAELAARIRRCDANIGIIGLGYVGLPLAQAIGSKGFRVTGFDVDPVKVDMLNAGQSYIQHIPAEGLASLHRQGLFSATVDFKRLADMDAILIAVPTPLNKYREPDLSYVEITTREIARHLRHNQLIVLESTTYPGTCGEVMKPILEQGGLVCGRDFFLAYSPEREDPGNPTFGTATIPSSSSLSFVEGAATGRTRSNLPWRCIRRSWCKPCRFPPWKPPRR